MDVQPDISTQSRVFISGSDIQGMVTCIPVGEGAGEMAIRHHPFISLPLMKTLDWVETSGNH